VFRKPPKARFGRLRFVAGLEVEFHIFRIRDPRLQPADAGQPGNPPEVELLTTGYQLLTEHKYDQLDDVARLLREGLSALELPLRSFEIEFGPSQLELTLAPRSGLAAADAMILLRSAVKQIADGTGTTPPHVPAEAAERDVERLAPPPAFAQRINAFTGPG
jgi:glutamine synthetase